MDDFDFDWTPQPQQEPKKTYKKPKPLKALKTCIVQLDAEYEIELVKGEEVHGLKRQEREHLKKHKFIG